MDDLEKSLLAFIWHATDAVLDIRTTDPNLRRLVAAVGVVWSAYWLSKVLLRRYQEANEANLVQIDRVLANGSQDLRYVETSKAVILKL